MKRFKVFICSIISCFFCSMLTVSASSTAECNHEYEVIETVESTCSDFGKESYRCTLCGKEYQTILKKADHELVDNVCTVCDKEVWPDYQYTTKTRADAMKIRYIGDRHAQHNDDTNEFEVFFSLMDESKNYLKVPAYVKIKIVDNDDNVVYHGVKLVTESDYSNFSNNITSFDGFKFTISDENIHGATSTSGKIYCTVVGKCGWFSFDEYSLSIFNEIPLEPMDVELPELPFRARRLNWSGNITVSCDILDVTFEQTFSMTEMTFTIEKTYDVKGDSNSDFCAFNYKIYDEENFVVDSGSVFSHDLRVGEKDKNVSTFVHNLESGKKYRLEIFNYD